VRLTPVRTVDGIRDNHMMLGPGRAQATVTWTVRAALWSVDQPEGPFPLAIFGLQVLILGAPRPGRTGRRGLTRTFRVVTRTLRVVTRTLRPRNATSHIEN
jgi:hypothetical protein